MEVTTEPQESEWHEFLTRTASASPFQSPEMMHVFAETRGYAPHVAAVESQGQILGLLASVLITYTNGGMARFATRAITQGGPIGDPSTFETLLVSLDSHASKQALVSEVRNINPPTDPRVFFAAGYAWEDRLDFSIDLAQGEEAVWRGMSKSRKKGISKATQAGLEIVEITHSRLASAYAIVEDTYVRARVPLADATLFESAMRILGPSGELLALGATHQDVLCAVRFILRGCGTLYDWYAGSSDIGRDLHADEWLVWEALKEGIRRGIDTFRFGGAGRPGEEYGPGEFKRRFGGQCLNPGRFVKTYHPITSTIAHGLYRVRRMLS